MAIPQKGPTRLPLTIQRVMRKKEYAMEMITGVDDYEAIAERHGQSGEYVIVIRLPCGHPLRKKPGLGRVA